MARFNAWSAVMGGLESEASTPRDCFFSGMVADHTTFGRQLASERAHGGKGPRKPDNRRASRIATAVQENTGTSANPVERRQSLADRGDWEYRLPAASSALVQVDWCGER